MQLYDWIFWLNPSRTTVNAVFTKIAMVSNHLQPLVLALAIWIGYRPKTFKPLSKALLVSYTVLMGLYTLYIWNKVDYTLPADIQECGKSHLVWEWHVNAPWWIVYTVYGLYVVLSVMLAYQHFPSPLNVILSLVIACSFALTTFVFSKSMLVGRIWCYIAAFIPLGLALWLTLRQEK